MTTGKPSSPSSRTAKTSFAIHRVDLPFPLLHVPDGRVSLPSHGFLLQRKSYTRHLHRWIAGQRRTGAGGRIFAREGSQVP